MLSADATGAQVIPAYVLSTGITHYIAQAVAATQLTHSECHKLRPTGGFTKLAANMMRISQGLELMSGYQFEQLSKDSLMMGQGLVPPIDMLVW